MLCYEVRGISWDFDDAHASQQRSQLCARVHGDPHELKYHEKGEILLSKSILDAIFTVLLLFLGARHYFNGGSP